jgi:hypothetical protein
MARTTVVQITDDLDGSQNAQEVMFSFDGVDYVIDLGKKNRAAFEKAVKPYLDAARREPGKRAGTTRRRKPARTGTTGSTAARRDLAAIRKWAKDHDITISDRGRIPAHVVEQYEATR